MVKLLCYVYPLDVAQVKFQSKREMLGVMLKVQNIDSINTIYVRDINADYEAALKNNMELIFFEWGYEKSSTFQYPINAINAKNLTQIILNKSCQH